MSFLSFPKRAIFANQNYPLHLALFFLTVLTTLWAGAFWGGHPVRLAPLAGMLKSLSVGIPYSASLLLFLTVHEFGHFFACMHHRVRATLPYYLPMPPFPSLLSLGTMGAVIKLKERMPGTNALFDIGIFGPVSGFAVCTGLLLYGFLHLPPADYITTLHPEYLSQGGIYTPAPTGSLILGKNLLWLALEHLIAPKNLPPMTEMYHYPFLFSGWLGSLVTALNLLPVGQLDGGHLIYAMFGKKIHALTAKTFLLFITLLGFPALLELLLTILKPESVSLIPPIMLQWSWAGWMLWVFILVRLVGLSHPPTEDDFPLNIPRKISGWVTLAIFCVTFTPVPFGIT